MLGRGRAIFAEKEGVFGARRTLGVEHVCVKKEYVEAQVTAF